MSLLKKKIKPQVGDITTTYDASTNTLSVKAQTAYDKEITINTAGANTGATSIAWGTPSGAATLSANTVLASANSLRSDATKKSAAEKEAERQERLEELSSSLENTIADFLPDADKDLPTQIAKAVVEQIFNEGHVAPLIIDMPTYQEAESQLVKNFQNMTMEEYTKIRPKLMKGVVK